MDPTQRGPSPSRSLAAAHPATAAPKPSSSVTSSTSSSSNTAAINAAFLTHTPWSTSGLPNYTIPASPKPARNPIDSYSDLNLAAAAAAAAATSDIGVLDWTNYISPSAAIPPPPPSLSQAASATRPGVPMRTASFSSTSSNPGHPHPPRPASTRPVSMNMKRPQSSTSLSHTILERERGNADERERGAASPILLSRSPTMHSERGLSMSNTNGPGGTRPVPKLSIPSPYSRASRGGYLGSPTASGHGDGLPFHPTRQNSNGASRLGAAGLGNVGGLKAGGGPLPVPPSLWMSPSNPGVNVNAGHFNPMGPPSFGMAVTAEGLRGNGTSAFPPPPPPSNSGSDTSGYVLVQHSPSAMPGTPGGFGQMYQHQQQQQQGHEQSEYSYQSMQVPQQQQYTFPSTNSFTQFQQHHHQQPLSPTSYTSNSPGQAHVHMSTSALYASTSPGLSASTTQTSWIGTSPAMTTTSATSFSAAALQNGGNAIGAEKSSGSWDEYGMYAHPHGHKGASGEGYQLPMPASHDTPEERTPHASNASAGVASPAPTNTTQRTNRPAAAHSRQPSLSISGASAAVAATRPQLGLGDILADDFYAQANAMRRRGSLAPSVGSVAGGPPLSAVSFSGDAFSPGMMAPLSPSVSGAAGGPGPDEDVSKDDPLATQVWKLYARTKATLPHAQRMENLTWRMMAMALRRRREAAAAMEADASALIGAAGKVGAGGLAQEAAARALLIEEGDELKPLTVAPNASAGEMESVTGKENGRGRNIDKGRAGGAKVKMRVEGFHTVDGDDGETG